MGFWAMGRVGGAPERRAGTGRAGGVLGVLALWAFQNYHEIPLLTSGINYLA